MEMRTLPLRYSAALNSQDEPPFSLERTQKERQYHVMDTIILAATSLILASSNLLLATEAASSDVSELRVLLIPLMGAIIVSCAAILLNPEVETRNIVIGRAAIAWFLGTATPSAIGVFFDSTREMLHSPAVLLIAGGAICGISYVLSRPFFARLYERADHIAKREVRRLERISSNEADEK